MGLFVQCLYALPLHLVAVVFGTAIPTFLEMFYLLVQRYIESPPVYTCGGTGGWRCVVYLDITDPSTTCPSGWSMTGYSKRTCGSASTGYSICDSVSFSVKRGEHSKVCGRIKARPTSGGLLMHFILSNEHPPLMVFILRV